MPQKTETEVKIVKEYNDCVNIVYMITHLHQFMLTTFKGPDSAKQKYTKTQSDELCYTLGPKPTKKRDY